MPCVYSLSIDATKVAKVLEVSHAHSSLFGGASPQDKVHIDGKTKQEILDIMDGKSVEHGNITLATKVKASVMSFQNTPQGIPVMEIVVVCA